MDFEDALQAAIRREHSQGTGTTVGRESEGPVDRVQARVTRRPARGSDATTADPEGDLTALGETTLRFDALARALTKKLRMLRTAIGRRRTRMSLSRAMDISATGLTAASATRIETIAQNIANVETVVDGGQPYRRREVVLASQSGFGHGIAARLGKAGVAGGVRVAAIREDTTPPLLVYRPEDPAADAQGYVHLSNVNLRWKWFDMSRDAGLRANAAAFKPARRPFVDHWTFCADCAPVVFLRGKHAPCESILASRSTRSCHDDLPVSRWLRSPRHEPARLEPGAVASHQCLRQVNELQQTADVQARTADRKADNVQDVVVALEQPTWLCS